MSRLARLIVRARQRRARAQFSREALQAALHRLGQEERDRVDQVAAQAARERAAWSSRSTR